MEDWSAGAKEVICQALAAQESIQAKPTDLESRARRNNMRIYGIPEDIEGDSVQPFIENFIKTELSLTDTELGVQRCHRALGPKPPQNANPRGLVTYISSAEAMADLRKKGMIAERDNVPCPEPPVTPLERLGKYPGRRWHRVGALTEREHEKTSGNSDATS
ncbi:hypothetical protein KUCAC02_016552 [Chaenocephalus aceratus]|nr:hypothetical protein KUCAC02_016552 [Chaenocephalus aceratus]